MRIALSLAVAVVVLLATAAAFSTSHAQAARSMPQDAQPAAAAVQNAIDALAAWPFVGP